MTLRILVLAGSIAALPALAGEFAVLSSGARIRADRHETSGASVRLYQGAGFTEIPASAIVEFETILEPQEVAAVAIAVPAPSPVPTVTPVPASTHPLDLIREAAARTGLPAEFVASVAKVESAFRQDAVSPKGAIGVMQLMPETAKALGADPRNPEQNIDAGARLLRDLLIKYDGDVVKALSAYNAGPGAVAKYNGLPPYDETRRYVNKVIGAYQAATAGD